MTTTKNVATIDWTNKSAHQFANTIASAYKGLFTLKQIRKNSAKRLEGIRESIEDYDKRITNYNAEVELNSVSQLESLKAMKESEYETEKLVEAKISGIQKDCLKTASELFDSDTCYEAYCTFKDGHSLEAQNKYLETVAEYLRSKGIEDATADNVRFMVTLDSKKSGNVKTGHVIEANAKKTWQSDMTKYAMETLIAAGVIDTEKRTLSDSALLKLRAKAMKAIKEEKEKVAKAKAEAEAKAHAEELAKKADEKALDNLKTAKADNEKAIENAKKTA